MGCASSSSSADDAEAKQITSAIDRELKTVKARLDKEVKLLLLGAGESGKSSVVKQMRILHGGSFTHEERLAAIEVISQNTVQSMAVVLDFLIKTGQGLATTKNQDFAALIAQYPRPSPKEDGRLPPHLVNAIISLWQDEHVRDAVLQRSREFQINDSAAFFFTETSRFARPGYLPTDEDILRSRIRTTGITETTLEIGKQVFRVLDVGGQRSERKKWIHCFEDVTAIIFCMALSEYDQVIREDGKTNRMVEALMLFDSIVKSKWFQRTAIVLFCNKIDIFRDKVPISPVADYFPDFAGFVSCETEEWRRAADFFRQKALSCCPLKRHVYSHFTCALDTRLMDRVIASVNETILHINLADTGMI